MGGSHLFCCFEIYLPAAGKGLSLCKNSDISLVNFPSYFLEQKPRGEILI